MMSLLRTLSNGAVFQSLRNTTLAITGSLCTIGGLVADVLQPIAPFASYLFGISLIALIALFVLFRRGREELLGAVSFAGVASAIFGLIVIFQSSDAAEDQGFVAAAIPAVADFQSSLGIIDQKLDAIQEDTQSLKESTARLEESSAEVLRSLEEIRASFAAGNLVASPQSPEDHYQNARIHELAGDYSAARRSYLEYFRSELPLLDPHLRFVSFLKVQEGTAGARETYTTLMEGKDSEVSNYVRILLSDAPRRIASLTAYSKENTDYAPAFYHLSQDYSERRLGFQTLAIKRREKAALEAFIAADNNGGLLKHMVDQKLVAQWREDAASRLQALTAQASDMLDNPVAISWGVNNSGYTGTVTIAEPALELLWSIQGKTEASSTGDSGTVDPRTGKSAPRQFFNLPSNQRDAVIEISYLDANNELQGPFEIPFKGKKESADANQRILESTSTSWVSFRDYDGKRLLYFSHLMTYRGSIKTIHYGLNTQNPLKRYRFPAWRKSGIAPIDEKTPLYITVPRSTRYVTVQLTYKDGTKSAVQRFDYIRQR